MCYSVGLPIEGAPEGTDKVLGALSQAMDAQDAGMAAAKGVREEVMLLVGKRDDRDD